MMCDNMAIDLRKVMENVPTSTESIASPAVAVTTEGWTSVWNEVLVLIKHNHPEMHNNCTFDDSVVDSRMVLYNGTPSALWFIKGGQCFLAVIPTTRGLIEVNSHIINNPGVFQVHETSAMKHVLVEITKADPNHIATAIYASQLSFPADNHTTGMQLLDVMGGASTSNAATSGSEKWASVWIIVLGLLEHNHPEMHTNCTFDDTGVANRILLYNGTPSALWFIKGGQCFLATASTDCGLVELKGFMEKHAGIKDSGESSCFTTINFSNIGLSEQPELIVGVLIRSQQTYQTAAQAIKQRNAKEEATRPGLMKLFPHMGFMNSVALEHVFRPVPTHIIPINPAFLRKYNPKPTATPNHSDGVSTLLFRGASGAGKSAAACSLQLKYLTPHEDAAIIGYFTVADDTTTVEKLAGDVATHMMGVFKKCITTQSPPADLGNIVCYVVVDEVGSRPDLVQEMVSEGGAGIKKEVVQQLSEFLGGAAGTIADTLSVMVSLVGTGVGRPSNAGGSLPDKYYNCDMAADLPFQVFKSALGLDEGIAETVMEAVKTDPLLYSMCTNSRCAQYAGAELGHLLQIELTPAKQLPPTGLISRLKELVRQNAETIVSRVSSNYLKVNGWGKQSEDEKRVLVSALLTIPLTQPHGYHIVPEDTLFTLTCAVGAMVDTLHWGMETSTALPQLADVRLQKIALDQFSAFPTTPSSKQVIVNNNEVTAHPHLDGSLRFVIPPAVLVVLLMWLGKAPIFGTGKVSPSSVYETILPSLTHSTLESFLRHSRQVSMPIPLSLLNPELMLHCGDTKLLQVPAAKSSCPWLAVTKNTTSQKQDLVEAKGIGFLPPISGHPSVKFASAKATFNASCGIMVEVAGEGVPQNDMTVYSRAAVVGEEYKYYTQGGYVDVEVLQKRAYQMGYQFVNITFKLKETMLQGHGAPALEVLEDGLLGSKVPPVHSIVVAGDNSTVTLVIETKPSGTSGLGKYHALRMRALLGGAPEYMVLCGPSKTALLPPGVDVVFTGRAAIGPAPLQEETMGYSYASTASDVPCKVVCKTFSIADFTTRCSGLLAKHDDVPHSECPIHYYATDDKGAITILQSRATVWYVVGNLLYTGRPPAKGDIFVKPTTDPETTEGKGMYLKRSSNPRK